MLISYLTLHSENSFLMHSEVFLAVGLGLEMSLHDVVHHQTRPFPQEQMQLLTVFSVQEILTLSSKYLEKENRP